jgi:hypothetical protein
MPDYEQKLTDKFGLQHRRVGVKNWSALNEPLFSKFMKLFPRVTQDGNRNGNKKENHFLRFGRLRRAGRSKVLDTSRLRRDTRTDKDIITSLFRPIVKPLH